MKRLAHIRQFVRSGDQPHSSVFSSYSPDVPAFPLEPGRFRLLVSIGTAIDDVSHALPEFSANFTQPGSATLVFHRIVQQGGNGHLFVPAVLDHGGRHTQKMPDIWTLRPFADLPPVEFRGVSQRFDKPA